MPHLSDVVEVSVWCCLLRSVLLVRVEHGVQVELLLQEHEPVVAVALHRANGTEAQHPVHLSEELVCTARDLEGEGMKTTLNFESWMPG